MTCRFLSVSRRFGAPYRLFLHLEESTTCRCRMVHRLAGDGIRICRESL
jgi:hypothetical protein